MTRIVGTGCALSAVVAAGYVTGRRALVLCRVGLLLDETVAGQTQREAAGEGQVTSSRLFSDALYHLDVEAANEELTR